MSKGYGIFNFNRPYKNDEYESVLIRYENARLNEMTDVVHLEGIEIVDIKNGDFIGFEADGWYYKYDCTAEGVYEIPYEKFKENTCFGIQDEEAARLIFEVYEIWKYIENIWLLIII